MATCTYRFWYLLNEINGHDVNISPVTVWFIVRLWLAHRRPFASGKVTTFFLTKVARKWIASGLGQFTFGRWIDVDWNVIIGRRGVRHMTYSTRSLARSAWPGDCCKGSPLAYLSWVCWSFWLLYWSWRSLRHRFIPVGSSGGLIFRKVFLRGRYWPFV